MRVALAAYDAGWPAAFEGVRARIVGALAEGALSIEHVGSTAVPDLAAKPVIDVALEVADSTDEGAYAPALEASGFTFGHREREHEHRFFKGADPTTNLHVYSRGCPEIARMIRFRDILRSDPESRELYERTKRELAAHEWDHIQDYADAKSDVVERILSRKLL